MDNIQAHEDINEASFTYLLLARQMIQEDRKAAIHCLGITEEAAEIVATSNPVQLLKAQARTHTPFI